MVRGLNNPAEGELEWMGEFAKGLQNQTIVNYMLFLTPSSDFRRRFLTLLSFKFSEFGCVTALSVLDAVNAGTKKLDDRAKGVYSKRILSFGIVDTR
jgi:N-acetyltransferase 10